MKLLFTIPDDSVNVSNQYLQVLEMTKVLQNKVDFFVLVEKKYPVLLRLLIILYARLKGYKKAFIYYSYSSLIFAKLFCFKTYFWHCYWQLKTDYLLILCLKLADCLVTGTKIMAQKYKEIYKIDNIKILPSWINLEVFEVKKAKNKKKTILFCGRNSLSKGVDWLAEISKKIAIKIVFDVPNRDIPRLLSEADLLISPSRGEGFPRIIIEAMAAGIPFVTTNVGGINNITTRLQKRYLVNFGDTNNLILRCKEILSDENVYRNLVADGKNQVKKYEIIKVGKKFYNLFI